MGLFPILLLIEFFIIGITVQPEITTDMTVCSVGLLLLNSGLLIPLLLKAISGKQERELCNYLLLSLILHICIILFDVFGRDIFILPNAEGDAIGFANISISYAFGMRRNLIVLNDYPFWCGQIYKLIGIQPITIQFINAYMALYSTVLIHKTSVLLKVDFEYRRKMVLIICFLPNLLIITSVFLRESLIAFCIVASIYFYTKWWFDFQNINLILALVLSFFGAVFHVGGLACAIGYVITMFCVNNRQRKIQISTRSILSMVILLFIALMCASFFSNILFSKLGGELSVENIVESAGKTDRMSDAEYRIGIQGLNPVLDLLVNSPLRMFYFLAAPPPWMWRGIKDILAFFGSSIFYLYVVWILRKLLKEFKHHIMKSHYLLSYILVLSIVLLIATLMFGWGVSNTGTALRHREKFTFVFALLYALVAHYQNSEKKLTRF